MAYEGKVNLGVWLESYAAAGIETIMVKLAKSMGECTGVIRR